MLLLLLLNRRLVRAISLGGSLLRGFLAAGLGGGLVWLGMTLLGGFHPLIQSGVSMAVGGLAVIPVILPELRLLLKL